MSAHHHRWQRLTCLAIALLLAAVRPLGTETARAAALNPNPPTRPVRLVFIHHSTGEAWLADGHGRLGLALRDNNYFVADTNYGWSVNGDVIGDRTDIGHWWEWFAGPTRDAVLAALFAQTTQNCEYSRLEPPPPGANEIVMFKSCFPNSHLGGEPDDPPTTGSNPLRGQDCSSEYHTVANAKGIYNDILPTFAAHQEKLFIVITAPPLRAVDTSPEAAANARAFNNWLVNDWLAGYPYHNVFVFDFYNVLTSNGGNANTNDLGWATGNHHRYRGGAIEHITNQGSNFCAYPSGDSHPSAAGDLKATGEFLPLLNIAYNCWRGLGSCPGQTGACTITGSATATPTSATVGQPVSFHGSVSMSGNCSGSPAFEWDFGDGSPHAYTQDATHAYQSAGAYTWRFTASMVGGYMTATGQVTVTGRAAPHPPRRRLQPTTGSTSRLQPSDLHYLGAFRLPDWVEGSPEAARWDYGGEALAYRPAGDPTGPPDGFPGSLVGTGLDQQNLVSEIAIPVPVISLAKNPDELPVATTLQPFADVRGGLWGALTELPRVGMCVLTHPQTGEKLHLAWGQHFQEEEATQIASHGWCNLNLAAPATRGAWWIDDESLYSVNGYILEIPEAWASAHVGGRRLGTGRYRDGGWSGMGPSLFAYAPWLSGNPPPAGTRLSTVPLLHYSDTLAEDPGPTVHRMNGYQHSDEWEGGAWVTTPAGKSAVLFAGTKGTGQYYWYGWTDASGSGLPCVEMDPGGEPMCFRADHTPCPPELVRECPNHTTFRGWWSSSAAARLVFYDPDDLARVAHGEMQPYEPQPYAWLDLDDRLFLPDPTVEPDMVGRGVQRRFRVGEMAYDRARGHLFILEKFADGAKPIVHVWRVGP